MLPQNSQPSAQVFEDLTAPQAVPGYAGAKEEQAGAPANGLPKRRRLPSRPLEELYRLPSHALVTAPEASLVTRLTESALAVRRSKGQWPEYVKIDGLVRYRLGALLNP
jgi:hypothetical protein